MMTIAAQSELELVARARSGSEEAFAELVRRHQDAVYGFAARLTRDPDRAMDMVQEAFLRAFRALGRYRGESAFRTWLFAITLNAVRSEARRRKRRGRREELGLEAAEQQSSDDPGTDRAVTEAEEAERVAQLVERLPPRQRATVVLRVYEEMSFREIGAVLGCSEGAARVNYHHAIKRLREMVS